MMDNRCVCCGEIIPEGRQICSTCEKLSNTTLSEEETLKSLELCWRDENYKCSMCPADRFSGMCREKLAFFALGLITKYKTEKLLAEVDAKREREESVRLFEILTRQNRQGGNV